VRELGMVHTNFI